MRSLIFILLLSLPGLVNAQKVNWEQTTVNFGVVRDWNSPPATFTFQNTGKDKLMFLPQRHDREVLVRYPNRAIRPGETGSITIQYYSGETGAFSRTVEVYSNASSKPERLVVKGHIKSIYADALTSCPSFQTTTPAKSGNPNVIQAVDAKTDRPIPGTQIEVYDRGVRKAINGTNLDGVAVNWIEPGKYIAVAYKQGYEKAENEVVFTKRNRSHVIYLNRKNELIEEQKEDMVSIVEPSVENSEPEEFELGITTNELIAQEKPDVQSPIPVDEQNEPFDLGITTNDQWEEPIPTIETETESSTDAFDLGIVLNNQLEEELQEADETHLEPIEQPFDLGINLNDQVAEVELTNEETEESEIEELVEAALEEADVAVKPVETEPEFSSARYKPNNVLLLLDVSGSMDDDGKMDKLKASIRRLVMMLREVDVLTLIAYNSSSWEVLAPTPVTDNLAIVSLVDSLKPSGYTNGVKGMESAYKSLEQQLIPDGNNQLIIATDGKFNSSKFSEKEAVQLVKSNSDKGIVLSIIGFGDDKEAGRLMKKLASFGGGNFLQVNTNEDPIELLAEEIKQRSQK